MSQINGQWVKMAGDGADGKRPGINIPTHRFDFYAFILDGKVVDLAASRSGKLPIKTPEPGRPYFYQAKNEWGDLNALVPGLNYKNDWDDSLELE